MVLRQTVLAISTLWILFACPVPADAFSFSFTSSLSQCGNITAQWTGGQSPFTLLLVPTGHLQPETRKIIQLDVQSGSSVSFSLTYPDQSQFVAVMSDATGIGSGGASAIITVGSSSDTSCLNTVPVEPKFVFELSPSDIEQCSNVNISWGAQAQGPIDILVIIPGGQTLTVAPAFAPATDSDGSTSFNWMADVRAGTNVVFVVGDKDGLGTGGSSDVLQVGGNNSSCIDNVSPSSTLGPPAGGVSTASESVPLRTASITGTAVESNVSGSTASRTDSPNASSSVGGSSPQPLKRSHAGLIAGIVVGILAFIAFLAGMALICYRRSSRTSALSQVDSHLHRTARPWHRLGDSSPITSPRGSAPSPDVLPPMAQATPSTSLLLPSLDSVGVGVAPHAFTTGTLSEAVLVQGLLTSTAERRTGLTRDVENLVLHLDEAPPYPVDEEVIELPPAYHTLRRTNRVATRRLSLHSAPTGLFVVQNDRKDGSR